MHDKSNASVDLLLNRLKEALEDEELACAHSLDILKSDLNDARRECQSILDHSCHLQDKLEQVLHDDQAKRLQIEDMQHQIAELQAQKKQALKQVKTLKHECEKIELKMSQDHAKAIDQLSQDHAKAIDQLSQDHARNIERLSQDYVNVIDKMSQDCDSINQEYLHKTNELNAALEQLEHYFVHSSELSIILEKYEKLQKKSIDYLLESKRIH